MRLLNPKLPHNFFDRPFFPAYLKHAQWFRGIAFSIRKITMIKDYFYYLVQEAQGL